MPVATRPPVCSRSDACTQIASTSGRLRVRGANQVHQAVPPAFSRRGALLGAGVLHLSVNGFLAPIAFADDVKEYRDTKNGFSIKIPADWEASEKAGAEVLFKTAKKYTNLGVTVSPVRVPSLEKFGTVDDVAQRVVKAEVSGSTSHRKPRHRSRD